MAISWIVTRLRPGRRDHGPAARRPTRGPRATTSSMAAATIFALSRTLRATRAVAAPETGVERDP